MKNISILLPFGNHSIALSSTLAILDMALRMNCAFEYQLVAAKSNKLATMGRFKITADTSIADIDSTDLIIISPIDGAIDEVLEQNKPLINWIGSQYEKGAEVISLCTGAYILAATGLLNGKEAVSHFSVINDLTQRFPEVIWKRDGVITVQDRIITGGGALSSLNSIIYWLLQYHDKHSILSIAKTLQIDYPRASQKPFYIFTNQKRHNDELILKVQAYMEGFQGESLSFDVLAEQYNISRRSLNRRFKSATGESLRSYQQRILIEKAKEYLETKKLTIQELAYTLGYVDVHSFRSLFHKITGTLPRDYQRKFSKV